TSGLSALRSVESKCKSSVPDDGKFGLVWDSGTGDDNGSGGEVVEGSGGDTGSGDSIGGSGGE
ncbi:hypothetical protein Tco_1142016, partial [Tanacetum coccineum]